VWAHLITGASALTGVFMVKKWVGVWLKFTSPF
jgi:hypothetical protein